jgi:NADH-quinone oxidoreductase subunit C
MSVQVLERLKDRVGDAIIATETRCGDDIAHVRRERNLEVLRFLRDDPDCAFNMCSTVTAVDYYGREPRFEVVYQLYSTSKKHRVRVRCPVPDEDPSIDSSVGLWSGNNWFEREVFDLMGIKFKGHPDLRRLFLWKSFEGHPLRKDYPKDKRQPLARREGLIP